MQSGNTAGEALIRRIAQHQIVSELGSDALGTHYLATGRDAEHVRITVFKHGGRDLKAGIEQLQQLRHPSLPRIIAFLEPDRALVTAHVHGISLRDMLDELDRSDEQFGGKAAIELGAQIADVLHLGANTSSQDGYPLQAYHGCLQPENIILTTDGSVNLLNFGLEQMFPEINPGPDDAYRSPEQARGQSGSHSSDLYSLGLILYELMMREAAPQGSQAALDEERKRIAALMPDAGSIIARMLSPSSTDRYPSGSAAAADLRLGLRHQPLKEFCSFFFSDIYTLPAPTQAEPPITRAQPLRSEHIAQQLRDSMSGERTTPQPQDTADQTVAWRFGDTHPDDRLERHRPDERDMLDMVPISDMQPIPADHSDTTSAIFEDSMQPVSRSPSNQQPLAVETSHSIRLREQT
jgi:serine/threonine protein kinase